jgi:hypothetical protein
MVEEAEEEDILEQTITLQCKYKILISILVTSAIHYSTILDF